MTEREDEALHEPGTDPHWQESFYVNWSDPGLGLFGLARLAYYPGTGKVEGGVLQMRDGRPVHCYAAIPRRRVPDESGPTRLSAGGLTLTIEEPLERLALRIEGRNPMDLTFEATTPPFDYAGAYRAFTTDLDLEHFEQSGHVSGWTDFHGERLDIDGVGHRDKSWGVRDWGSLAGWDWISAQCGEDLAFNASLVVSSDGATFPAGFVFRDGANHAIKEASVHYQWGRRSELPAGADLEIVDDDGGRFDVSVEARGSFPVYRKGAWIEEVQADFTVDDGSSTRTGHGVVEHGWQPGTTRSLRLLPELLRAWLVVLRP